MYYLEAKVGNKMKYWTGRKWITRNESVFDDLEVAAWKRESTAARKAFKLMHGDFPHLEIKIYTSGE